MYSLSNFEQFDSQKLSDTTQVLVWSRATGYFFTTFSQVAGDLTVIAVNQ